MKPFRADGRHAWKVRLALPGGRDRVCGCDTYSERTAKAMGAWAASLRRGQERRMDVYTAIVDGRVPLSQAYDRRGDLDGLMASLADINIEPFVAAWHAWKSGAKKGAASADKYEVQLRTLLRAGVPFLRSQMTSRAIRKHLAGLDVDDATRNRYKAAFSSFCRYLVDHDVLSANPVREIPGWPTGESRQVWYEMRDAQAVIGALPQPHAALEAIMCGACLEWQAIERLTLADVDPSARTFFARGTKHAWRTRTCKLLEIFEWCWPYIEPMLGNRLPTARLFDGITERRAIEVHHAAVAGVKLVRSTLHDWRHTHLVLALKAGYPPIPLSRQAGHKDAHLLWTVYGKHIPELSELRPRIVPHVTPDAETAPVKRARFGGKK